MNEEGLKDKQANDSNLITMLLLSLPYLYPCSISSQSPILNPQYLVYWGELLAAWLGW